MTGSCFHVLPNPPVGSQFTGGLPRSQRGCTGIYAVYLLNDSGSNTLDLTLFYRPLLPIGHTTKESTVYTQDAYTSWFELVNATIFGKVKRALTQGPCRISFEFFDVSEQLG